MKYFSLVIGLALLAASAWGQEVPFEVCENCWNADSLGNHRAVINVNGVARVVKVTIPWRRRDANPQAKNLLVTDDQDRIIQNVVRENITRESGTIYFEPITGAGVYHVYYLQNENKGRSNYPTVVYPPFVDHAEPGWKSGINSKTSATGVVQSIQSIDSFNSFFPMEVIASATETKALVKKYSNKPFLVFPEDRRYPVIMKYDLPYKWIKSGLSNTFSGELSKGENYTYQLGVFAANEELKKVKVEFSDLHSGSGAILSSTVMSCLNTHGVNWDGKEFTKEVNIKKGMVQPLWCLVDTPLDAIPGIYSGKVLVSAENKPAQEINISLTVTDKTLSDHGVDEPWNQTRLTWLNSRMAMNNEVIKPYAPLSVQANTISLLGRELVLGPYGLPQQIKSYFSSDMTSITDSPMQLLSEGFSFRLNVNGSEAISWKNTGVRFVEQSQGIVKWQTMNESVNLTMEINGQIEFDGFVSYSLVLTAKEDLNLGDTRLEIPMRREAATYFMGLGERGGYLNKDIDWKWDVATKNQDGAWLGAVNGGLQFSLRDENYSRPLNTNFYLQKPLILPSSWGNDGKGGITVDSQGDETLVRAYSGGREMKKGEVLHYNFNLLLTPFHTIDTDFQWSTRFYHRYSPVDSVLAKGATVVNVHHATEINPYINYPFIRWKEMKAYIDEAHSKQLKVKIYNTIRELSNRAYETQPMRSLGTEIYSPGPGGGFSWLQEHLVDDYIAAWFVPELKDAAVINSGMSRWHNYYVEGMSWLVKNVGIDGIYLDDVAFDRTTMKRIRRVLASDRGPGIIDLHSANQFNKRDGFTNSANLYMEHFPYLNRLWFGEYFDYNMSPDFWLVEVSGIPFGLMGEMLEGGGNKWRGMVYGMTNRLPWGDNDPSAIWKFWDDFGMKGTEMIGYWSDNNPVAVNNEDVKVSVYKKDGALLLAIASWAKGDAEVKLTIDWDKLGMIPKDTFEIPAIAEYQEARSFKSADTIRIPEGKGYLILVK